jgi:hypothetical protein
VCVCVCVCVCVDVSVCERERGRGRGREKERERERESQAASKLGSISVKRDLVWRQKRPSKDANETWCRGKTSEQKSSVPPARC